ncbi:MAG: glycoside hydrolase family 27 protein [Verrucomicrobiota bacterium]
MKRHDSHRFLRACLTALATLQALPLLAQTPPAFWSWADKPVMGWNSWDYYGTSVNEEKTKAQADYMAANLLSHGWNLITVDIQWYEPNATGFNYNANATLEVDGFSRLIPAGNRFPSAANGAGFKPLADYVHAKGLKFGIHMMRGISRQSVRDKTPIKGTAYTADQIADTTSTCPWNADMYGVDMTKPGAQAYYDSIMEMVASWEVDFVKIDDLSRPYHLKEIEGIRKAIDKTGRAIVFSTSPGETPVAQGAHVRDHANQWRISDDFWDLWTPLYEQFKRLHDWTPYRGPGHFPDADMLPIGKVEAGNTTGTGRATRFTIAEQYTLMSLWAIARSPLIHGGDMTQMDGLTLSLLTNDEVLAVNQHSTHNRQLFRTNDQIAWVADVENSTDKYLAVFNATASAAAVPVSLASMGFSGACQIRSLWTHSDLGSFTGTFSPSLSSHEGAIYRISGTSLPTPWLTAATAGDQQVSLAWEPLASATAYQVNRATVETGPYQTIATNLLTPEYLDPTVANGTTYYYTVSATIGGSQTPDSGIRSATPAGVPQTVSWNYDRFGTLAAASVAGANPVANWNNSYPNNPLNNLIDSAGAPTTLDITYSSYNTWSIQASSPALDADGTSNKRLLNGYLNAGPAAWSPAITRSSVTLSEIPHAYYDLIVYFSADAAGREGNVTDGTSTYYFSSIGAPSISGTNASLIQTTRTDNGAYPAANYAVFTGLTADSRTIAVQMRDNDEWGGIAGFQVDPKTDPLREIHLQIQVQGAAATLTWPTGLGTTILEESTDLSIWRAVDPQPVTNSATIPVAGTRHFFRLSRP